MTGDTRALKGIDRQGLTGMGQGRILTSDTRALKGIERRLKVERVRQEGALKGTERQGQASEGH